MYYLEIIMGQYTRSGAIKIWDVCPIFRGVGIGIIILNMFVNVYFIILMVWPMHFMFASIYAWFAPLFGYGKSQHSVGFYPEILPLLKLCERSELVNISQLFHPFSPTRLLAVGLKSSKTKVRLKNLKNDSSILSRKAGQKWPYFR